MRCPKCDNRLKCEDSKEFSVYVRTRRYYCAECKRNYVTEETIKFGYYKEKRTKGAKCEKIVQANEIYH